MYLFEAFFSHFTELMQSFSPCLLLVNVLCCGVVLIDEVAGSGVDAGENIKTG